MKTRSGSSEFQQFKLVLRKSQSRNLVFATDASCTFALTNFTLSLDFISSVRFCVSLGAS